MIFRLLSNGKGVITSRQPKVVKDNATFLFNGAPEGATAVFAPPGTVYYRPLQNGRCNIPSKYLEGDITVAVSVNGEGSSKKRIPCESIKAEKLSDGSVLIVPNDCNLPEEFASLRVEVDELRTQHKSLEDKYRELEDRLDTYMSGYNLT